MKITILQGENMHNKFLLTAINAKYIHSNLAVRYIKEYCKSSIDSVSIKEFSINDSFNNILKEIYNSGCNVIAFSCYIWNIELVLKLARSIKKILPKSIIILGGPEVSYDYTDLLNSNPDVDFIIAGEGELTFLDLAKYINEEISELQSVDGIAYKHNNKVYLNKIRRQIDNLDIIPFPYVDISQLQNKIIYYETSRGCPFNCQYCLSSTIHGIRFFSLERIKSDIAFFVKNNVKQVKLVDRTFNCDKKRSIEIIQYIIDLKGNTNFHFEIAADLIDNSFLEVLSAAPEGLFQFEIGVQSTNTDTLYEIKRKMNFDKVRENVLKIIEFNNAHVHLDLIAGLPYESFDSFKSSFNAVYNIKADMLQLGFLKLLKGSGIRKKSFEYSIEYNEHPPYEVLSTKWMSYEELLKLKNIEHLLDIYHNSGKFRSSLDYIIDSYYSDAFSFYYSFSDYWVLKNYYDSPKSLSDLCVILYEFITSKHSSSLEFNEIIKFDWILHSGNNNIPSIIKRYNHAIIKEVVHYFIKTSLDILKFANSFINIDAKNILKYVSFEVFFINIAYKDKAPEKTLMFFLKSEQGNYKSMTIPLDSIYNEDKQ